MRVDFGHSQGIDDGFAEFFYRVSQPPDICRAFLSTFWSKWKEPYPRKTRGYLPVQRHPEQSPAHTESGQCPLSSVFDGFLDHLGYQYPLDRPAFSGLQQPQLFDSPAPSPRLFVFEILHNV